MNENINDRIMMLINHLRMNKNSFSIKIGLTNGTIIGNIISGRLNKPSYHVIYKILKSFDNINGDWLITGRGQMLNKKEYKNELAPVIIEESKGFYESKMNHDREIIVMQRLRIESLDKAIKAQEELINELRRQLPNVNGARSA